MTGSADRTAARGRAGEAEVEEETFASALACSGLPQEVAAPLLAAGFNLAGVLRASDYDALVPQGWSSRILLPAARVAILLGCGGQAFSRALSTQPEATHPEHPFDRFAGRVIQAAVGTLRSSGWQTSVFSYLERRDSRGERDDAAGEFLDLIALARASGMGETGRLRLLLHPTFGPWMSIRGLLLSAIDLPPSAPSRPRFDPCAGCSACEEACKAQAFGPPGPQAELDMMLCHAHRLDADGCSDSCAARRACVLGSQHAYASSVEAHHMRISIGLRSEWKRRTRPGE